MDDIMVRLKNFFLVVFVVKFNLGLWFGDIVFVWFFFNCVLLCLFRLFLEDFDVLSFRLLFWLEKLLVIDGKNEDLKVFSLEVKVGFDWLIVWFIVFKYWFIM